VLGTGLDIRGDGGYVVVPPSTHESGRIYKWTRGLEHGLVAPPEWLFERRNGSQPAAVVADTIPEGQRDATLASLAGSMRRRGMSEAAILAALAVENKRCTPPLANADLKRIARSIASYSPAKTPTDDAQLSEPFALQVVTAQDLCAQPDPDRSGELLGPLVVEGYRLLIGGHTGEGKTTLALAFLAAILDGREMLGFTGRGGVRALLLDAEQGAKSLKRRLRETGLDAADRLDVIRVPDGLPTYADPRHVAEFDRILRAGEYSVVVADPLYKLHAGDSNAEREAVDLMRHFDAWRDELGFALALPIHCRKPLPQQKFSIHDLFGSSAYVRGAEVVLGLQRVRDGYSKLHFLKDRDGDLPIGEKWGLLFDREEGFRRDPDDGEKKQTAADRIQELLEADSEGLTQDKLQEISGYKERTVRDALRNLGAIKSTRPGPHGKAVWKLPADDAEQPQIWSGDDE